MGYRTFTVFTAGFTEGEGCDFDYSKTKVSRVAVMLHSCIIIPVLKVLGKKNGCQACIDK